MDRLCVMIYACVHICIMVKTRYLVLESTCKKHNITEDVVTTQTTQINELAQEPSVHIVHSGHNNVFNWCHLYRQW